MTDTEPTTAQLLHHRGTCSRPAPATWPIPGGARTVCPECGRFTITWVSAYRCREHLDEAVSWRGTGCRLCPKRQPKIRKAKRPSDDYTEERDR